MPNTGKSLTNVAFRAKILAVIDKLKNQDKTALVRHVDDFEALNKDTFEAGMNALVEAIPEGGGGGGGSDAYEITANLEVDMSTGDLSVSVDKTISDIISHSEGGLFFNFNFSLPEYADVRVKLAMLYTNIAGTDPSLVFIGEGKDFMNLMYGEGHNFMESLVVVNASNTGGSDEWGFELWLKETEKWNPGKDNDPFKYFNATGSSSTPSPYRIEEQSGGSFNNEVSYYFNSIKTAFKSIPGSGYYLNPISGYREVINSDNNTGYEYYNKAHCIWIDFKSPSRRGISFSGFATCSSYYFGNDDTEYIDFYIDVVTDWLINDPSSTPEIHRFVFRFWDDNNYNLAIKEFLMDGTEVIPN